MSIFKIHLCLPFPYRPLSSFHVRRNPRLYSRAFAPFTFIPGVGSGKEQYVAYFWNSRTRNSDK